MDQLENLRLQVVGALYSLSRENLVKLCVSLHIEHDIDTSRSYVISTLVRHFEREGLEELEDGGMSELLCVRDKICELQLGGENISEQQTAQVVQNATLVVQVTEQERLQKEIDTLQLALQKLIEQKHNTVTSSQQDVSVSHHTNTQLSYDTQQSSKTQTTNLNWPSASTRPVMSTWSREFKISGQIGEPGQKDKLSFSSLAHQIEHGRSRGFSELEIVDAVIRAIAPGMQLRSYLEGKTNLTLPTLRRILRAHFQERGATELYKQLTSEVQSSKETPQSFLVRCLDLRQKILFASQEAESSLKYDPKLVQSMFLHTILTGLQNDSVRGDLRPYLTQTDVSDELLFDKVNLACAHEAERQSKKKLIQPCTTKVHIVQSSDTPMEKKGKTPPQHNPDNHELQILSELREMRSGMALLKDLSAEVSQIKESIKQPQVMSTQCPPLNSASPPQTQYPAPTQYPPQYYWQPYDQRRETVPRPQWLPAQRYHPPATRVRKCFACQQSGLDVYCSHCYKCGGSDHFSAGCRARMPMTHRDGSLNEDGSRPRDRQ